MRIFQDLVDEDHDHHRPADLSGTSAEESSYYYDSNSSGCDSSTEEFGISASSPRSLPDQPAAKKDSTTSAASAKVSTSPRTVRFDLGAELTGDAAALLKRLTQAQADLAAERTVRRRKEKTIVKLAKELNRRIVESEKKDGQIRELRQLLEERERKLESVLSVAGRGEASSSSSSKSTKAEGDGDGAAPDIAAELKRFLLADAMDQQAKKSQLGSRTDVALGPSSCRRRRYYAALASMLLVVAAVGVAAAAACALDLGGAGLAAAVPSLF